MIFVCTGSRDYQFNRLLQAIDGLVERKVITDHVIAQIGGSDYQPKHYEYYDFIAADQFKKYQMEADLIISHAGTGALIGALKLGKQVIAVPRLAKYNEHIDDHQTQISGVLAKEGYLREVLDMDQLEGILHMCQKDPIIKRYDRPSNILDLIIDFIEGEAQAVRSQSDSEKVRA